MRLSTLKSTARESSCCSSTVIPSKTANKSLPPNTGSALRRGLLVLFAFFSLVSGDAFATHLAGGQISYTFVSANTYRVRLSIYRDCAGVNLGSTETIRVSPTNSGSTFSVTRLSVIDVTPTCPGQVSNCSGGNTPGIEEHIYEGLRSFSALPIPQRYTLSWESCCRNYAITTLQNPGSNGFYVSTQLDPNQLPRNSSPAFQNPPVAYLCAGQPATISPNASDPNGDALQYFLTNCQQAGPTTLSYGAGFSGTNPLSTASGFNLNINNGALTFTPTVPGQVGVICLRVDEFRGGTKIGEVVRDIQVRVLSCNNTPPVVSNQANVVVPVGQQFCANFTATDADNDGITLTATGSIVPPATFVVTSNTAGSSAGTFCFTPTIANQGQTYTITINAEDDACPATATGVTTFNITVPIPCNMTASATGTDASCGGASDGTATVTTQNGTAPYQYTWSNGSNSQTATGLAPGTYTVTVVDGNSCVANASVTIGGASSPIVVTTSSTGANCGQSNGSASASASGGSAPYSFAWSNGSNSQTATGLAPGTYTVTVTDNIGCTETASVTVGNAADVTAPVLSGVPANALATCTNIPAPATVTAADDCDANVTVNFSQTIQAGNCAGNYTITRTWSATDQAGNTASATQTISVSDVTAPVISCPAAISVPNDLNTCGAVVNYTATATDNCSGATVSYSIPSGTLFSIGITTVTATATDGCGNTSSCSFTVEVYDHDDPIISCPSGLSVSCTGDVPAPDVSLVGTSDNCPGTVVIHFSDLDNGGSGCVSSPLVITRTYVATDVAGNTASCTQSLTVVDQVPPTIICPADAVVECGGSTDVSVTGDAIASDNCSSAASQGSFGNTYEFRDANGGEFIDYCGAIFGTQIPCVGQVPWGSAVVSGVGGTYNVAVGIDQLWYVERVDYKVAPVGGFSITNGIPQYDPSWSTVTIPNPIGVSTFNGTFNAPTGSCYGLGMRMTIVRQGSFGGVDATSRRFVYLYDVNFQTTSNPTGTPFLAGFCLTSGAAGPMVMNSDAFTPGCGNTGVIARTFTATDACGNTSSCVQDITIQDNTDPVISCPANIVVANDPGNCAAAVSYAASASDGCGTASIGYSQASGSSFPVGSTNVTATATDECGNSASCSFSVTVNDAEAPNAVCQDITVQLGAGGSATIVAADVDGGSSDNCGVAGISIDNNTFDCSNVAGNTTTLTVTDVNGNSSSCTATVTVEDNVAPNAVCQDVTVQLDANGAASIAASDVDGGSNDNCAIASTTVSPSSFDCSNVGGNTVTLTVTDVNGNSSPCTATVTVEDNVAPNAVCQDVTVQLDANGAASISASDVDGGSNDNCAVASISIDNGSFDCANVGGNTVTLTVTDVNGNSSSCTANVAVEDNVAPNAVCQDITVQLDASGAASIVAGDVDGGSSDNCAIASTTVNPSSFDCSNVGGNTVTLTVTDVNGNSSSCTANVAVEDNVAPNAVCQDITINLGSTGSVTIAASDVDGGSNDNCGIASLAVNPNTFACADLGSNTVTLTVTDVNGNVSTCQANVQVTNDPLVASLSSATYACGFNVSCNGATDGSVASAVSGGCEPYSYSWSNGATSADISGLGAGSYTLTVTDANGNSTTASITLTEPDPVVLSLSSPTYNGGWNISCNGNNDGSINATTTGGCGPYSYSWTGPNGYTSSMEDPAMLFAGTYMVVVTDLNGCSTSGSITLTEPDVLVAEAGPNVTVYVGYPPTECVTLTGMAMGGTNPYSVSWSEGSIGNVISNTGSVTVCPQTSSIYYYQVVDANGCYAIDSLIVCALDVTCTDRTNNGQTGNGQSGNGTNNGNGGGQGLTHISICHIPQGNPSNAMTKCIPISAVPQHLAHGDYLGACGTDTVQCTFDDIHASTKQAATEPAGFEGLEVEHMHVEAFPNPTSGQLKVELLKHSAVAGTYQVKVVDMMGQVLSKTQVELSHGRGVTEFNLGEYANGFYFIVVEGGGERLTTKVMKN